MADTAMGPAPLERQDSVPMEIMNKCAYGEPSTKTIMIMGAVAAVLASITVYCIVSWARRSARAKFKAMIKSVFEEVDHDHGGTVDSDELYTAVLLVYLQVNKAIRVIGAVKPPKRHSVDEVLAQYAKDNKSGKELNQDQFEDVMKILSKDVAGRVTVTCGIMVGCPMLGGILVNMALAKFGRPSAARPCGSLLFTLLEPQFPTIVSLVLMLVLLPLLLDALDSYLENRQSKLGAMKELVRADSTPKATATESSVRKEAEKLAQAVETAAEEVKPVAEAAPKKKKGFSPFKGFGKKKEA